MAHLRLLGAVALLIASSCNGDSTAPRGIEGSYTLVAENGQPLPSDPSAPFGCCLTLSGSLSLTGTTYDLRTSHRNKNNGINFENSEQGTYTRQGDALSFTRSGGGGEGFPYLGRSYRLLTSDLATLKAKLDGLTAIEAASQAQSPQE